MADALTGLDTDEWLAIGMLCITFGIGVMCLVTIFCRSFCVNEQDEPTDTNETNTIQENLLLQ
jgi:predicted transcriptional regulator YheO